MKNAQFLLPTVLLIALLSVIACSKSNSSGKPTIKLKSINTEITLNQNLNCKFDVQSSGADIDSFVFIRIRTNEIPLPPNTSILDTFSGVVPSYPNQNKVEYTYYLPYSSLREAPDGVIDSFEFKYAVVDKAGHSSDTMLTPLVVVHNTQ